MEDWIVLDTFSSESEARVVESKLRSEGIAVQLLGSHSRAAAPVPELIRIMVAAKDLEQAKSILKTEGE